MTAMIGGRFFGKDPKEGAASTLALLFNDLEGNGRYYGSDAVRSPLHVIRNPGEPAFTGYQGDDHLDEI